MTPLVGLLSKALDEQQHAHNGNNESGLTPATKESLLHI
jgi:hypothetical protein